MTYGFVKTDFERPEILVFSSRVNTFASHLKIIFYEKTFYSDDGLSAASVCSRDESR